MWVLASSPGHSSYREINTSLNLRWHTKQNVVSLIEEYGSGDSTDVSSEADLDSCLKWEWGCTYNDGKLVWKYWVSQQELPMSETKIDKWITVQSTYSNIEGFCNFNCYTVKNVCWHHTSSLNNDYHKYKTIIQGCANGELSARTKFESSSVK